MKPLAKVQIISALRACRNHVDFAKTCSQVKAIAPPPPTKPIIPDLFSIAPTAIPTPFSIVPTPIPNVFAFGEDIQQLPTVLSYFGNPCLDLFFRVVEPNTTQKKQDNRNYLDKLLPLAWSHNPLNTLKLICNLLEDSYPGKNDRTAFYEAVSWLHDNHPKTLACNLAPIATCFGFDEVLGILFRILVGHEMVELTEGKINKLLRQGIEVHVDMAPVFEYGPRRYENDSDYRFLHDRVTDLFADCLKSDIEQFNQLNSKLDKQCSQSDEDNIDNLECLEITIAGNYCPHVGSWFDCATSLSVSIAKKMFPRISYNGFEEEEAEHAERAVVMLMKEVLVPLHDLLETPTDASATNEKGYHFPQLSSWRELQGTNAIRMYLNTVKAGGKDKIWVHDMFPHDIIGYAYDCDELREAAELQWKTMVESCLHVRHGRFKNCLAVCDVSGTMMRVPMDVSVGLGLLVSELSEEPWNGKVITFNRNPQMVSVQGDDLRSKCAFVRKMDNRDWHCAVDFAKVFDLILEVAVKGNLKAEQMIKRVFVFTIYYDFDEISLNSWEKDYEEIQRKYKEKGYVVPHLVVWNLSQEKSTPAVPCTQPGVTMLPGLNDNNLMNLFLEKDGDIGPDHVMEAALSAKAYQNLVVVD